MNPTAKTILVLSVSICVHLWLTPASSAQTAPNYEKKWLSGLFFGEGAHFGDFNNDGTADVVSGPYIYDGPDYTIKHAYTDVTPVDPLGYSNFFLAYTQDVDHDGWTDVIIIGFPGKETRWYRNPGKDASPEKQAHWDMHIMHDVTDNESPMMANLVGDETPELVCMSNGHAGYAVPDPTDPTKPWVFHKITPKLDFQRFTHGIGAGDVNGDGRMDLLEKSGWWEQPESLDGDPEWKKHPHPFAEKGSAQMYAYDVDGDGDNDVITSLEAHGYGLAWYEHVKSDDGAITFKQHLILSPKPEEKLNGVQFSQLHAVALVDMDNDGLLDILTGKRYWAHGPTGDPEPNTNPVLYYFRLVRSEGKAPQYVPTQIDTMSGVGTQIEASDINGDKRADVIVGNKKGTILFLSK